MPKEHEVTLFVITGRGPEWIRTAGLSDDGTVFLPAEVFGSPSHLFLMCSFDGVEVFYHEDRLFVPTFWLKDEFSGDKKIVEVCETVEAKVKGANRGG